MIYPMKCSSDFWKAEAFLIPVKPLDLPPPEALYDYRHDWWIWLDQSEELNKRAALREAIP